MVMHTLVATAALAKPRPHYKVSVFLTGAVTCLIMNLSEEQITTYVKLLTVQKDSNSRLA